MVYLGRPSRGCQACKNRRIKCDETRPQCHNCLKTNRPCPGLPEEVDLIFRAETPGAARKKSKKGKSDNDVAVLQSLVNEYEEHQHRAEQQASQSSFQSASSGPPGPWYGDEFSYSPGSSTDHAADLVQQMTFNPLIEKQATAFFFNNFVLSPRHDETTRGFLELAVPLFHASQEGSPLHLAIEAVSVSIIANWPGRWHLQQKAARLYGQALQETQKALQDTSRATSDTTLLAILMFSLYETVASSDRSVQAWAQHIEGAVAIVRARGVEQFKDPQSLLLFRTVRTQMLTNAIQQRTELPEFPGPKGWLGDLNDDRTTASAVIEYSVRLPTLLAQARSLLFSERSSQSVVKVSNMLKEAFEIQRGLLSWELEMPPEWGHRSVPNRRSSATDLENIEELEIWPGPVMHIYKDFHVACIRNNNRVSQILCSSIVIDALKWLNPDPKQYTLDERWVSARNRLQKLVDEICYSVPFHVYGQHIAEAVQPSGKMNNSSHAIGGYFLIWPLSTACSIPDIPEEQRHWMRGRLVAISRQYGLGQTSVITDVNKRRSEVDWNDKNQAFGHRLSESSAGSGFCCSSNTSARTSLSG